jgi:hypothetical protein
MATFTLELKTVIEFMYGTTMDPEDYEQTYESVTFGDVIYGELPVLADNGTKLGIGGYPIFDANYRKVLNGKILDRYWNREICTETIDDWRLIIRRKMNEIMPFYNKLYETEQLGYSALDTMSIHSVNASTLVGVENAIAENVSTSDTDSKARVVNSDTPQTMLAQNADYASGATDSNSQSEVGSQSNQTSDSTNNTESDSDTLVTGYQGAASDLVVKFRNSLLNIDTMILDELNDCFMQVLNNGDTYTRQHYPYGWGY